MLSVANSPGRLRRPLRPAERGYHAGLDGGAESNRKREEDVQCLGHTHSESVESRERCGNDG